MYADAEPWSKSFEAAINRKNQRDVHTVVRDGRFKL